MGMFTLNILQEEAGVNGSNSALQITLCRMGYGYRRTRKKGTLTRCDKLKRFKFAKKMKRYSAIMTVVHVSCGREE